MEGGGKGGEKRGGERKERDREGGGKGGVEAPLSWIQDTPLSLIITDADGSRASSDHAHL